MSGHRLKQHRLFALMGPAFIAAIAYVDPGNVADVYKRQRVTTDPAPTTESWPIVTPWHTVTPLASHTLSSIVMGSALSHPARRAPCSKG